MTKCVQLFVANRYVNNIVESAYKMDVSDIIKDRLGKMFYCFLKD